VGVLVEDDVLLGIAAECDVQVALGFAVEDDVRLASFDCGVIAAVEGDGHLGVVGGA